MIERDYGIGIIGLGEYIPNKLITNNMIEKMSGISENEIIEKTGIETRFVASEDETASGMSLQASQDALDMANIPAEDINLILGCTFSGDYRYPAMACKVQADLKAWNAAAYDILANCTSFQVGISTASDRMYCDETVKNSLVLGTTLQSRYINWNDKDTAMYCGDASGAAVLGKVPKGYGILSNAIVSNGRAFDAVRLRGGGSSYIIDERNVNNGFQFFEMNGIEVWKQVIQWQPKIIRESLEKINLSVDDVDFFIFHQANMRLIEYLLGKMKVSNDKTFTTVKKYGNTGDASLAVTLCEAVKEQKIKRGDLVVLSGVGAGFIFGSTVMRWY